MADHPFANAGLGNFGVEKAYSQAGMQGGGKGGLFGTAAGYLLDQLGIKDYLDNTFGEDQTSKQPVGSVAPVNPMYQQGVNPTRLPNAVPGGIGLNAKPAGVANPFQFPTTPAPQILPDDEHRNQIKSAWS